MTDTYASSTSLQTAVLLLVFNRPDTTAKVFQSIRQVKPRRLYVAADGARVYRAGEAENVAKVREIATAVDWACEVKTLFSEENLGCKYGPERGISWFFKHEEQGIILEDDCLPHPDFFRYCEYCLAEFKDNKTIWHVNGNNFAAAGELYPHTIEFVSLAQVWGWASWADRWKLYEKNAFYLYESALSKYKSWDLSKKAKLTKIQHVDALTKGLDAWDYQWQVSILNAGGLAVTPSSNLISNLGDGPEATHTKIDDLRLRLPTAGLRTYKYSEIKINKALSDWYESKMGLKRNMMSAVKLSLSYFRKYFKRAVKKFLNKLLFLGHTPIVIASTGRSGSTMLTSVISQALVNSRFEWLPTVFRRYLIHYSMDYMNRMYDIDRAVAPVIKTHDLYRKDFVDQAKFIFVFGDPFESAQSVIQMGRKHGLIWIEEHIYHLAGRGNPYEIFERDVLNYEALIKSWGDAEGVYVIHYNDLWNEIEQISEFLGFELRLPERRERTEKALPFSLNLKMFENLRQQELELRKKVSRAFVYRQSDGARENVK